jgi:hypothetical protein
MLRSLPIKLQLTLKAAEAGQSPQVPPPIRVDSDGGTGVNSDGKPQDGQGNNLQQNNENKGSNPPTNRRWYMPGLPTPEPVNVDKATAPNPSAANNQPNDPNSNEPDYIDEDYVSPEARNDPTSMAYEGNRNNQQENQQEQPQAPGQQTDLTYRFSRGNMAMFGGGGLKFASEYIDFVRSVSHSIFKRACSSQPERVYLLCRLANRLNSDGIVKLAGLLSINDSERKFVEELKSAEVCLNTIQAVSESLDKTAEAGAPATIYDLPPVINTVDQAAEDRLNKLIQWYQYYSLPPEAHRGAIPLPAHYFRYYRPTMPAGLAGLYGGLPGRLPAVPLQPQVPQGGGFMDRLINIWHSLDTPAKLSIGAGLLLPILMSGSDHSWLWLLGGLAAAGYGLSRSNLGGISGVLSHLFGADSGTPNLQLPNRAPVIQPAPTPRQLVAAGEKSKELVNLINSHWDRVIRDDNKLQQVANLISEKTGWPAFMVKSRLKGMTKEQVLAQINQQLKGMSDDELSSIVSRIKQIVGS